MISWDKAGMRPGIGSARSVPGFNLHAALGRVRRVPARARRSRGGGRPEDRRAASWPAFAARFAKWPPRGSRPSSGWPSCSIDVEAPLSAFTLQAVQQIERLAPFGQGNSPAAAVHHRRDAGRPAQAAGQQRHHLAMMLSQHGVTLAGRGLRRRRLGRRTGRARRPDRRGLPPGDQQLPRPAERRAAPGRLAGESGVEIQKLVTE